MKNRAEKLAEDSALREKMKRPRNWKECGWAYVSHFVQGFASGFMASVAVGINSTQLAIIPFTLTSIYIAYQGCSFARKRDTVGVDISDYGIGYGLGLIAGGVFYLLKGDA